MKDSVHEQGAPPLLKNLLALILPITLQSLISSAVNAADVVMTGKYLWSCALYCIGKSFNSTLVGGIFCAGGDTRFGLLCDTIVMWGIIFPLGCICAFVLQLPPVLVYLVLCTDELIKMPAVFLRYRQKKWLNNLTRPSAEV